jgi:hypothetical protein
LLEVPVHPQIHTAPVRSRMMKRYGFMYYIHVRESKNLSVSGREKKWSETRRMNSGSDI